VEALLLLLALAAETRACFNCDEVGHLSRTVLTRGSSLVVASATIENRGTVISGPVESAAGNNALRRLKQREKQLQPLRNRQKVISYS
jgi:Zinc knuckle